MLDVGDFARPLHWEDPGFPYVVRLVEVFHYGSEEDVTLWLVETVVHPTLKPGTFVSYREGNLVLISPEDAERMLSGRAWG